MNGIEIELQIDKTISGEYIVNIFRTNGIEINKKIIEDRKNKGKYNSWQLMKESTCDWEIISPILQECSLFCFKKKVYDKSCKYKDMHIINEGKL